MNLRRIVLAIVAAVPSFALALATVTLLSSSGCSTSPRSPGPAAPTSGNEVTGTLIAKKDDRPVDGGIDLTIETGGGNRQVVRVPSIFIVPPRDAVRAMHEVVDASKIGDRIRARGTRDEDGNLRAETLELIRR